MNTFLSHCLLSPTQYHTIPYHTAPFGLVPNESHLKIYSALWPSSTKFNSFISRIPFPLFSPFCLGDMLLLLTAICSPFRTIKNLSKQGTSHPILLHPHHTLFPAAVGLRELRSGIANWFDGSCLRFGGMKGGGKGKMDRVGMHVGHVGIHA